jgi:hypothetical protein
MKVNSKYFGSPQKNTIDACDTAFGKYEKVEMM